MFSLKVLPLALLAGLLTIPEGSHASAASLQVLYSFTGGADGADPWSSLTFDKAGNLYGATYLGGAVVANSQCFQGCGVVFELSSAGKETPLYSFKGFSANDGQFPLTGVVRVGNNIFGSTHGATFFYGTVYKVTAAGVEKTLHTFTSGADGGTPNSLFAAAGGVVEGTAQCCSSFGAGNVFSVNEKTGAFSVTFPFVGGSNGQFPAAGLIGGPGGVFYGTLAGGGNDGPNCTYLPANKGCGEVYEIPSFNTKTTLYQFLGGSADGAYPAGPLVRDGKGNLYGTTNQGGGAGCGGNGCGIVFKLSSTGVETVLHRFTGEPDGGQPQGGLALLKGFLYGVTTIGGSANLGTVFSVNSSTGKEAVVHSFTNVPDGANPQQVTLITDSAGALYGTTAGGGAHGYGTVFKLTP
jgi:uncharacterized repeat protein (TIGR03803 family)